MTLSERMVATSEGRDLYLNDVYYHNAASLVALAEENRQDALLHLLICFQVVCRERERLAKQVYDLTVRAMFPVSAP